MRFGLAVILVLVASMSGCATEPSAPTANGSSSASYSPPPPAPPPKVSEETGALAGNVVDDEIRPIEGAKVSLLEKPLEMLTDGDGRFSFSGLPPGPYRLFVSRAGFEDGGGRAEVQMGQVTNVTITLKPAPIALEPYHVTLRKTAYLKLTWVYATNLIWPLGVNNSDYNNLVCNPCRFVQYHEPNATDILTETQWLSGTTAPVLNNQVWLRYAHSIAPADADGTQVRTGYWKNRQSTHWTSGEVTALGPRDRHELWVQGDLLGINFEHKVEVFTTMGYLDKLPAEFTALPPP